MTQAADRFVFERYGRAHHLKLSNAEGLAMAARLDEAHWVATSAPTQSLRTDPDLLKHLDPEGDGRIQAREIKASIRWLLSTLKDHRGVTHGARSLKLEAIERGVDDGDRAFKAAAKILARGAGAQEITLAEVRAVRQQEEARGLSEAGHVLPAAAQQPEIAALMRDILACGGGKHHLTGEVGVTDACLDDFLEQSRAFIAWWGEGQPERGAQIAPFGAQTARIFALVEALGAKIEQHFILSQAVELDARVAEAIWPSGEALGRINFSDRGQVQALLTDGPLARPEPGGALTLGGALNPAYAGQLRELGAALAELDGAPVEAIEASRWRALVERLAPYRGWRARRPEGAVGDIPVERLEALAAEGDEAVEGLRALLRESHRNALVVDDVRLLEKLILFQAHLLEVCNSFVSFPDLYNPKRRALFEMGTLIMDGRRFDLAVKVHDRARHARLSDMSNMFVLYVEVCAREGEVLHEVAVPVTSGGRGNLQVGKHGIFCDIEGVERFATVVHIVENPISLIEAIVAPFKRLGRALSVRIEKLTEESEKAIQKDTLDTLAKVPHSAPSPQPTPTPAAAAPPASKAGMVASGGIALAAMGSAAAFMTQTISQMGWEAVMFTLMGLALLIIAPVALMAMIKLHKRDLSAILEGSGWGINARMRLIQRQARTFTFRPPFPPHAEGARDDLQQRLYRLHSDDSA